jgi:radical SAM protein with 4Fe4S-binding SPASM domain
MADELRAVQYKGAVVLCGFGEPLLHPQVVEVVRTLSGSRVEIVTNGDKLTRQLVQELFGAGLRYLVVSLYDGPHQVQPMRELLWDANLKPDQFLLRDRWHTETDDFGLKLTNRAGTVTVGNQDPVDVTHPCNYLSYQLTVDWNGDVLLCVQDWHKKVKYGNLAVQSMMEVWTSPAMHKRRMQLAAGRRREAPCSSCNTDGTLHGFNHVPQWEQWSRG